MENKNLEYPHNFLFVKQLSSFSNYSKKDYYIKWNLINWFINYWTILKYQL